MPSRIHEHKLFGGMKKVLTYSLIGVTVLAIGATTGIVMKRVVASEEIDYGTLDFESMKPDCNQIVKNVESYKGSKDLVDAFSASDILNYSMEKFRRCENNYSLTFGLADTIIKQEIKSCTIKNGNQYFEESVSKSSMIAVGNRMYQSGVGADIDVYQAKKDTIKINETDIDAEYNESQKTTYKNSDYSDTFGKTLDEVFIYLTSNETVKDSKVEKLNDGYSITVELDPDISTYFYKHQMKNVSNLDKYPVFEYVTINYLLTKDLMLKKCDIDEQYVATMIVDAPTHGTLETYFFPNEELKIPEINEKITYHKGA